MMELDALGNFLKTIWNLFNYEMNITFIGPITPLGLAIAFITLNIMFWFIRKIFGMDDKTDK